MRKVTAALLILFYAALCVPVLAQRGNPYISDSLRDFLAAPTAKSAITNALGGEPVTQSDLMSSGDPVARLAFSPEYSFNAKTVKWGGYGAPTAVSSTFAGWGEGVGIVADPFSAIKVAVYPFDLTSIPTNLTVRIKGVAGNWPTTYTGVLGGSTNPTTWPTIIAVTNSYFLKPLSTNILMVDLGHVVATTSNLWVEVTGDGRFSVIKADPSPTLDSQTIPPPGYSTIGNTENWMAAASPSNKVFTVEFGDIGSLSGVKPNPALITALGLSHEAVFSLPVTNYAVSGTEFNLYFRNILRSSKPLENLWADVTCAKGTQYSSFFRLLPVDNDAGTHSLTITASDGTNMLSNYSGKLKVVADSAGNGATRKLLVIGDSTVANGTIVTELNRISATNGFKLETIGTQGTGANKHEGRSGWTIAKFFSGNESPFTNAQGVFDFAFYLTQNSLTMTDGDWVFVDLGINDVFSRTTDAEAAVLSSTFLEMFRSMTTNMLAVVPGIRVGLCVTIPPSNSQDAFGVNYASGQTFRRYERNRFILAEKLAAYTQTGVHIIPIAGGLDTVHNMPTATEAINARNATEWTHGSNGVHPAESGYFQIADQMWAALKCFEVP